MNYVFLIYAAEARYAALSADENEALMQAHGTFSRDLEATGRAGDCAALELTGTATSVRIREGKRTVKDGPFAETREQLGGYYSFSAETEDEALGWAAKIPDAEGGTIEVRPLPVRAGAPKDSKQGPVPEALHGPEAKGRKEYMLLIYENESRWANIGPEEFETTMRRYTELATNLAMNGQLVAGAQLDSTTKGKSVSVTHGKRVVKDGPFAETREQLGGYYRVFAKDLDEAIAIASRIPAVETGTIEIRPVMDTSMYE